MYKTTISNTCAALRTLALRAVCGEAPSATRKGKSAPVRVLDAPLNVRVRVPCRYLSSSFDAGSTKQCTDNASSRVRTIMRMPRSMHEQHVHNSQRSDALQSRRTSIRLASCICSYFVHLLCVLYFPPPTVSHISHNVHVPERRTTKRIRKKTNK